MRAEIYMSESSTYPVPSIRRRPSSVNATAGAPGTRFAAGPLAFPLTTREGCITLIPLPSYATASRRLVQPGFAMKGSLFSLLLACVSAVTMSVYSQNRKGESAEDYFRKWLNEDVLYLITPDEKKVFERLRTEEEKQQFIEQFWSRRDPTAGTPENEFKEEHYR